MHTGLQLSPDPYAYPSESAHVSVGCVRDEEYGRVRETTSARRCEQEGKERVRKVERSGQGEETAGARRRGERAEMESAITSIC